MSEEGMLSVFESRVLRIIFGPKSDEVNRSGENNIMRCLITCTPHPVLFG